jgi:hypothetical protein
MLSKIIIFKAWDINYCKSITKNPTLPYSKIVVWVFKWVGVELKLNNVEF